MLLEALLGGLGGSNRAELTPNVHKIRVYPCPIRSIRVPNCDVG